MFDKQRLGNDGAEASRPCKPHGHHRGTGVDCPSKNKILLYSQPARDRNCDANLDVLVKLSVTAPRKRSVR